MMEGQLVSHYRVLEKLGGGGMGVVYQAEDTRLKRPVALKFLPPELTRDDEAKERFMQEAQAASALDHTNICTIHEIDETPAGQMFLAMSYYEGETLKKRIARGPLPIAEALDIAVQIARGLAKAHEAGIVHRDIKPANLILTGDGVVKILDFGIAKLIGQTGLTRTGTTVGTVAYMAPEQLNSTLADHRTDLWALGMVLYEMVCGQAPFHVENELAVINAILNERPRTLGELRPEVPAQLEAIVARALEKRPEARYQTALEFENALIECRTALTARAPTAGVALSQVIRNPWVAVPALIGVLVAGAAALWAWNRGADTRWAREEGIPQIRQLADQGRFALAFDLAERVERILPQDPELAGLWPQISGTVSLATTPPDADVLLSAYSDGDTEWASLGRSPVTQVRLPRGAVRVQVRKDGFETLETIGVVAAGSSSVALTLPPQGSVPPGMVAVEGAELDLGFVVLRGAFEPVTAPGYYIDRYEVTNEEFKKFVDAGAYQSRDRWSHPLLRDGGAVSWESAMATFRDATGRPGPSTWSVGTFADGQGNHPVSGVSWYEAAAYCEFVAKQLPTIYHWGHAASVYWSQFIGPASNFGTVGLVAVGSTGGLSRGGAYDMAGNVREWVWNTAGNDRYIVGGAWNDPQYKFSEPEARTPFDRSSSNGFRCASYAGADPIPAALGRDIPLPRRDYVQEQAASDELFEAYKAQYQYDPRELNAIVASVDESEHWRKEKITFDAAYGGERVIAYLYLPKSGVPPYQTVVYVPGAFGFRRTSSEILEPEETNLQFLLTSGRALMWPVYKGTYDRNEGLFASGYAREDRLYRDHVIMWVQDFMRSVDYLETRAEIDTSKLAYYGASWGGQYGPIVAAVEPRVATVVLSLGGLPMQRARPEVDPINFIGHTRVPVLLVGGEYDYVFPLESSQRPLIDLLGTPDADRRHVIFDGVGHDLSTRRNDAIREVLAWLDKYLGPVK